MKAVFRVHGRDNCSGIQKVGVFCSCHGGQGSSKVLGEDAAVSFSEGDKSRDAGF